MRASSGARSVAMTHGPMFLMLNSSESSERNSASSFLMSFSSGSGHGSPLVVVLTRATVMDAASSPQAANANIIPAIKLRKRNGFINVAAPHPIQMEDA